MVAGRDEMDSRETGMSILANGLGKKIRAALDGDNAASEDVRQGRKHFIDYVATRDVQRASSRRLAWLPGVRGLSFGFVGAAAVAAAVLVWMRLPISFQVDSDSGPMAVAGNPGDLIEANAVVPTAVRFSEGSSIVLERGGRLRVLSLESNGARVLVEKGAADVAIAHRHTPGKWRFEAGPVTVDVTGTRFRVDWNPEDRSFGIDLKEGSVIVGGDCLGTPRRVQRGDSLRVTGGPATKMAKVEAPSPRPIMEEKGAPTRASHAVARRDTREMQPTDEAGDWRALVAAGRYAEGVRAAEHAGWARVCRSANAVELL